MPQVNSTGPHDPNNSSPGHAYNSNDNFNKPKQNAQVVNNPTIKDQVFHIVCSGMKPSTLHKFYYEGVDLSAACMPVNPKPPASYSGSIRYGAPLITDSSGKIEFRFHFTVAIEKQVDAANKVKYALAGNKKFELIAADSSANKMVPFTKALPAPAPSQLGINKIR